MAERPKDDPTPQLSALLQSEPDLVDRIFEYVLQEFPDFAAAAGKSRIGELKLSVRQEFAGDRQRIGPQTHAGRRDTANQVLRLFNGRNATEVARRLRISRASVYRYIKSSG